MFMFSIIIPTYNRSAMLPNCLASLRAQSLAADGFEIIIVDNASTDDTRAVVADLNLAAGPKARYVFEARRGLHWARHAGAKAAQGQILAYTDDDAIAEPTWLSELAKAYTMLDADCAGGKILIRWDREPPAWVIPYEKYLGRLDHGPTMRLLNPTEAINGGSFSIRRDRLYEIGGFNPDQVGDYLVGDGETGLCYKIHQAGWKMAWAPDALIWHCQTADRNGTLADMKRRFANNGAGAAYAYYRQTRCRGRHLARCAARAAWGAVNRKLAAVRGRPGRSATYYRAELEAAQSWREAVYYLQLLYDADLRQLALKEGWIHDV